MWLILGLGCPQALISPLPHSFLHHRVPQANMGPDKALIHQLLSEKAELQPPPPPKPPQTPWASISLIQQAGAPWEWSSHMASPWFCLLDPSESTHPRRMKRGAYKAASYCTMHSSRQQQRLYLGWCCSVCLTGLWCGNLIPEANTGLLTSEGWCLLWMLPFMMANICELTAKVHMVFTVHSYQQHMW